MIFFDERLAFAMLLASVIYWLVVPERHRTAFVTGASWATLLWIQPIATVWLTLLVVGVFVAAKRLADPERKGRVLVDLVVLVGVALLAAKNSTTIASLLYRSTGVLVLQLVVPLGVSYLCFKLLAFVIDAYRGIIAEPSLRDLLALIFFLPTFPAGPIQRYQDFQSKHQGSFDAHRYVRGLQRITFGYLKKIVVVGAINGALVKELSVRAAANDASFDLSAPEVLSFLLASLLYVYVDISSYADLAIGYGRLFGYEIIEDMNNPLLQSNLSDYWARWHMSLSSWCRDNVFFPVLASTRRNTLALYASFFVMGVWHNTSINWVLWGLWHATGLVAYSSWRRFRKRRKLKPILPKLLGHAVGAGITALYVSLGLAFVMLDGPGDTVARAGKAFRLLAALIP